MCCVRFEHRPGAKRNGGGWGLLVKGTRGLLMGGGAGVAVTGVLFGCGFIR